MRSAGPFSAAPATIGETATTCVAPGRDRVAHAGHREDRADRHDRVRRRDRRLSSADRRSRRARPAPGCAARCRRSGRRSTATSCWRPTKYSWKPTSPSPATTTARLDRVVGHRHDPDAEAPRGGDLGRHLRQRRALVQPVGAVQVGARSRSPRLNHVRRRSKPAGALAVALQRVHRLPGLAGQAPARLGVDRPGQRVGDGVEVGADVEAVQHGVVAGVDDRGDLGRRAPPARAPTRKRAAPDAAGQHGDHRGLVLHRLDGRARRCPRRSPSHENAARRATVRGDERARVASSSSAVPSAAARASTSAGSTSSAASPATSGMAPARAATTGTPAARPRASGSRSPRRVTGRRARSRPRAAESRSSSSIQPVSRTRARARRVERRDRGSHCSASGPSAPASTSVTSGSSAATARTRARAATRFLRGSSVPIARIVRVAGAAVLA